MTTKERLLEQNNSLKANLITKGVNITTESRLSELVPRVLDIEQGGSDSFEWRDPLWPKWEEIWEAEKDSIPGYTLVMFYLMDDSDTITGLIYAGSASNMFKTSDGYLGGSGGHTWDKSKDIPSSTLIKTRYILSYAPDDLTGNLFGTPNSLKPLGIYSKSPKLINTLIIGSSSFLGIPIVFLDIKEANVSPTIWSANNSFTRLQALKYINLPSNLTVFGQNIMSQMSSFNQDLTGQFPSLYQLGTGSFANNTSFNSSTKYAFPVLTTLGNGVFANNYNFNDIWYLPKLSGTNTMARSDMTTSTLLRGVVIPAGSTWSISPWDLSASTRWTKETVDAFLYSCPINTQEAPINIILGTVNLAKASPEAILFATNQNLTLS